MANVGGIKGVACIKCGAVNAVRVDIATLGFSCSECSEDFTSDDVKAHIIKWERVMLWCDLAQTV